MRFWMKSVAFLGAGLLAGSGVLMQDLARRPETTERQFSLMPVGSTSELMAPADLVVLAELTAVREGAAVVRARPGDEGWVEGEPADLYTALRFRPVEVLKGRPADPRSVEVLVMTGVGDRADRPRLRVLDERLRAFQRADGTMLPAARLHGRQFLLLLEEAGPGAGTSRYRPLGRGIADLLPGGELRFPSEEQAHGIGRLTLAELRARAAVARPAR
jgi:hypothetical protein